MATSAAPKKTRKLRRPTYKAFRLQKRIKLVRPKLPSVITLCKRTLTVMLANKKFFLLLTLLYGVLGLIFIQSATTGIDVESARESLGNSLGGAVPTNVALYIGIIGGASQLSSQVAAFYQFVIIIIFGLAVVYGLRHMYGPDQPSRRVTVREALYKGMTPLIPVLLILVVLTLQLLPISIGSGLYATVVNTGLAITNIERLLWLFFVLMLAYLSIHMISGSILGLFIVTLPDMTPMRALRASRELVRFRRLEVIRKIVALPLILLVVMGIIMMPFIVLVPNLAQLVFFVISTVVFPIALSYMYNLYRSML